MNSYNRHPENPKCTQAYKLVARGERQKAITILEGIGYQDALHQVEMIEGFIKFQEAKTTPSKGKKRNGRLLQTR
jgi:hypothetical protein